LIISNDQYGWVRNRLGLSRTRTADMTKTAGSEIDW
jgi:hypothetical protein